MKKLINSVCFFSKLNFRNPIYIISVVIALLYLGVIIYTYSSSEITNPGNMLQLSSYLIQGYMLIFMILGYFSIKVESVKVAKELFLTIPKSCYIKIASNYLFILLSNIVFCIFAIILFMLVYVLSGYVFSDFYIDSIFFVFIYWFVPAVISSLIGVLVGLTSRKKISISILFGIWLLISPMNVYFSDNLFRLLGFDYVPGFFHLGVPNPIMSYHAFSGFVFTKEDLINKLSWIVLLLTIILIVVVLKSHIQKSLKILINLLLVALILFVSTNYIYMESKINPTLFNQRNADELNYYAENRYNPMNIWLDYDVEKYDIYLAINKKLDAAVELYFQQQEQGIKYFNLYHGFKVNKIMDEFNNAIDFKQEGDFIKVNLKEETKKLKFIYSGISSPYMDANNEFAYLPFYFAWIPLKNNNPSMKDTYNSNHRLPTQPQQDIDYVLNYKGNQEVFTNLEKVREGEYKGESKNGIYLIYGELKYDQINNYKILYPITWENSIKFIDSYLIQLEKNIEQIKRIFKIEGVSLPKKILLIPAIGANDILPSELMWYQEKEQLTILINPYEHHDETIFKRLEHLIPYQILGALLWKNNGVIYQNDNISILFSALAGHYLNEKTGVKEQRYSEKDYWLGEVLANTSDEDKEIISDISALLSSKSDSTIEKILLDWSKLLQSEKVTWNDVSEMVKKYR